MKYIRTGGILLMLVVFPAISWYYLQKGFEYRKTSYDRLQPKTTWNLQSYANLDSVSSFSGKTTVLFDSEIDKAFVLKFFDQFKESNTFQSIVISQGKFDPDQLPEDNFKVAIAPTSLQHAAILIDTGGVVRNYYQNTEESLRMLIEDVAVTIPRTPSRQIVSKK